MTRLAHTLPFVLALSASLVAAQAPAEAPSEPTSNATTSDATTSDASEPPESPTISPPPSSSIEESDPSVARHRTSPSEPSSPPPALAAPLERETQGPTAEAHTLAEAPVGASPIAEGLAAEFGQGITLRSDDGDFSLTLRGRIQARAQLLHDRDDDGPDDTELGFLIRRMRLVFLGNLGSPHLQFYVQLGFAPGDLERDQPNPIRDAVITWLPTPSFGLRVGQTKVPFNRERVISSSALQLVDRSIVNAELNLDRDVGVQVFHNDLFGLDGRLGFQAGVFGGDGRNRLNRDVGLLYVARVQAQPTGRFDDAYSEADLVRSATPRLSFGAGVAYNQDAHRARSTHGNFFQLDEGFDVLHVEADLAFKWAGFSLLAEMLWRRALADDVVTGTVDGQAVEERFGSALGVMVQAGFLFPRAFEIAARFSDIRPTHAGSAQPEERELLGGLGWYILDHNLKLQADYGVLFAGALDGATHQARMQLQLFY